MAIGAAGIIIAIIFSFIPAFNIIGGVILGISITMCLIKLQAVKCLPLIQVVLILTFSSFNPIFGYITIASIYGCKGVLKTYKGFRKRRYETEGVIASTMEEVNNQWWIHIFWVTTILIGSVFTGTIFGLHIIENLSRVMLYSSFFLSPLVWIYFLFNHKKEKGTKDTLKFLLGGILSSSLLLISLFLFKEVGALGILLPFILLGNKEGKCKPIGNINTKTTQVFLSKERGNDVLLSGLFRTFFVFFSGEALMQLLNKGLSKEESFINGAHSEAISEGLQPVMLWGFLLSRGEMDTFSQLSMEYILSSQEIALLILIIIGLNLIFFYLREEVYEWVINDQIKEIPYIDMGICAICVISLMGNPLSFIITLGLSLGIKFLYDKLSLNELSKSMGITFVPIGLNVIN